MAGPVPAFARRFHEPSTRMTRIGDGSLGGKAQGLARASRILAANPDLALDGFDVDVPALTVLATDLFDRFLARNGLAQADLPDDHVAEAFQKADLPTEIVGDLRAIAEQVRAPLAVRSSSALEDALNHPLAGVYLTKMLPGNQPSVDERFRRLTEAVKLVYASTFFAGARSYRQALGVEAQPEQMAVILQEVVGRSRDGRFYPDVSGVARSVNMYPIGPAHPEAGVVSFALGLGKTIVDGGACWSVSPLHPRIGPPFSSARERLKGTQTRFWAVNVGAAPPHDPIHETEYLVHADLEAAEADGTLALTASTYDPAADRTSPGIGRPGARVLDFAPLLVLEELPLAAQVRRLLEVCAAELSGPVEIEFAVTLGLRRRDPARLGVLQVRPLAGLEEDVRVEEDELFGEAVLASSTRVAGNGVLAGIHDVVFVDPGTFTSLDTRVIAEEVAGLNARLVREGRRYLLIGFGRWGTADPALGIPVTWPQVAGAAALVEAALPDFVIEPSQGSHFFHNLVNQRVSYLSVGGSGESPVDWEWLLACPVLERRAHARLARTEQPLTVRVDGRRRRGVILKGER